MKLNPIMNICITNYDMSPQFIGGIKRVSSILAKEWIKECDVYFLGISPADNQIKDVRGIPQFHLPVPENILSDKNLDYFIRFINEKKINIILHQHSENKAFTELCVKARQNTKAKLVTTRHFAITHNDDSTRNAFFIKYKLQESPTAWIKEMLFFSKYHLYKRWQVIKQDKLLYKYLIENSDKFVVLSGSFIKDLEKRVNLNKYNREKLHAINNPIEIHEYEVAEKKKRAIWCGRVEYGTKRVDRVLEIWKAISQRHPDWELYIIGSGNINYFEALVKKHNILNVTFTGSCDPYKYYKDGSILCMTSSAESWGMVLVEAQMFGCIPIAYDSYSSLPDIITDGINGFTIPAFDKKEFAKRLEWLMGNETERQKMINACQESAKRFDAVTIAKQWLNIFKEIADK